MNNLSIDLRPRELADVIGHESVKAAIQKQIDGGKIPRAFMFSGPAGLGKTTLALIVAKMIQGPNCDNPDITELNSADTNGVDDIRSLVESCAYRPFFGRFKVLVLNESQMLTAAAQNVLLAPFEAEDSSTVFILTTTAPEKIIQPLQDRCQHFRLKPLSAEVEIAELVERAAVHLRVEIASAATSDFIAQTVNAKIGSPRQILQAFEKLASGVPLKDCYTSDPHDPLYKDIALSVVGGDWNKCRSLLQNVQTGDSRALRSIVSGFLGSALVKQDVGPKADAIATCLMGLGAAFEDGIAWGMTRAAFYKCAKAISGAK